MSGIRKSLLARKYVSVYHKWYDNLVWLDAAHCKIRMSVINLSDQLGLSTTNSQGVTLSIKVMASKIHNYYRTGKTLYVFDNVDDVSVKHFMEYVSNLLNSFTLVTSQWRGWTINALKMDIETFSLQDALCFMSQNIKTEKEETLKKIAEDLRFHPFALHQSVIYINNTHVSLKEYVEIYRSNPIAVLDEFLNEAEGKSAVATINIVLKKLQMNEEFLTLYILNCLSYCDGKIITPEFLKQLSNFTGENNSYQISHAITVMINFSLINLECDLNSSIHHMYSMHEITQLTCQKLKKNYKTSLNSFKNLAGFIKQELSGITEHVDFGFHWYKHFIHMFLKQEQEMGKEFESFSKQVYLLLSPKGLFHYAVRILKEF